MTPAEDFFQFQPPLPPGFPGSLTPPPARISWIPSVRGCGFFLEQPNLCYLEKNLTKVRIKHFSERFFFQHNVWYLTAPFESSKMFCSSTENFTRSEFIYIWDNWGISTTFHSHWFVGIFYPYKFFGVSEETVTRTQIQKHLMGWNSLQWL